MVAEERQAFAKLIKEFLGDDASNRQIAKAIGVAHTTVDRDLGTNVPASEKTASKNNGEKKQVGTNVPNGAPLSGAEAARLALRSERAAAAREERIDRIAEIAKGNSELGTAAKFPIIYADPPWSYENPPLSGGPADHYPLMTFQQICELPVADLATDDSLLYLWSTAPNLPAAIKVLSAWGFEYRTNLVWVKDRAGLGFHARNQHELLLIGKRGNIPPPRDVDRVSSVIFADRGKHSEKTPKNSTS